MKEYTESAVWLFGGIIVTVAMFAIAIFIVVLAVATIRTIRKVRSDKANETEEPGHAERTRRKLREAARAREENASTVSARAPRTRQEDGSRADAEVPAADEGVPPHPAGMVGVRYREPVLRPDITGDWRRRIAHPDCPGLNRIEARLDGWYDLDRIEIRDLERPVWRIEEYDLFVERWVRSGMSLDDFHAEDRKLYRER